MNSDKDLDIWEKIFADVPLEWTQAEPTDSMLDCLKYFNRFKVRSVLDLGCGVGIWSLFLARSGLKVTGIDYSANAIEFAKNWADEENLNIRFQQRSLQDHSFKVNYDGVLAAKVLENIPVKDLEVILEGIHLCLGPGGILYALFNPYMDADAVDRLETSNNPTRGITMNNYSNNELRDLFPNLTLEAFKTYDHGFRGLVFRKPIN